MQKKHLSSLCTVEPYNKTTSWTRQLYSGTSSGRYKVQSSGPIVIALMGYHSTCAQMGVIFQSSGLGNGHGLFVSVDTLICKAKNALKGLFCSRPSSWISLGLGLTIAANDVWVIGKLGNLCSHWSPLHWAEFLYRFGSNICGERREVGQLDDLCSQEGYIRPRGHHSEARINRGRQTCSL